MPCSSILFPAPRTVPCTKELPKKHLLNRGILKAGYRTIIIKSLSLSFLPPPLLSLTLTHKYNWKDSHKRLTHVMEFLLYSSVLFKFLIWEAFIL